jgi:hypothetical protein
MVTLIERFEKKFCPEPNTGCWLWHGATTVGGYGVCGGRKHRSYAHRWSYEHFVGPIPDGLEIDHLCRVRCCVNPDHLEPVTHEENLRRGESPAARCSRLTHCPAGHAYDEANTMRRADGSRECHACFLVHQRARSKRFRAARKIAKERGW